MIEKLNNSNFYNSKILKKGLKFISENSAAFTAGTSLAFAAVVRPISTMLTPSIPKEDKKISFAKTISSALNGFIFTTLISAPFSKSIKNIDKNPEKYLTSETIKNLSNGLDNVSNSKSYKFITQLFKLGLGFLLAYPKAVANNVIIPKVMGKKDKKDKKDKNDKKDTKDLKKPQSFKGKIENLISATINNKNIQKIANKAKNTNYTTHLIALGDIFSTVAFSTITNRNKKLDKHQKKILNYNAAISTLLCLGSGYGIEKLSDKPMQKFIENLKAANKNSPDLAKYIEGAKIAKTSLIFATIYYGLIPFVSTYISSKLVSKQKDTSPLNKNNL